MGENIDPTLLESSFRVGESAFGDFQTEYKGGYPSSSSLSFKRGLRESGCRIGYDPTKNELRSLSAVDIQGHQRGGLCMQALK